MGDPGPLHLRSRARHRHNRTARADAFTVLLVPLVAFFLITQIEHTLYLGFEPQRQFRAFVVTFALLAVTVLAQYLILRLVVPNTQEPQP
jgi:hypothetical protein